MASDKSRLSSIDLASLSSLTPEQPPPKATATGAVNQEELMEKLKNVPLPVLRDILNNQIDLEIRLKHKELKLAEDEVGKCEAQMLMLRKFFEVPNSVKFESEPNEFTIKYFDLLNKSLAVNYTNLQQQHYKQAQAPPAAPGLTENYILEPVHSYRTRSTTSSLRPSVVEVPPYGRTLGCLYRRTDGVVVKLTCPDCQRSNFSSAQGFLNHSRIAHSKEYTSQDAAALKCGEILGDNEQDEEGLASLKSLKEKGLDPNKNLNVNEIYFNGLSNTLNTVHRTETKPKAAHKDTPPESSKLMEKLIKSGVASNEDEYKKLVSDARDVVKDLHLFEDEEEGDSETPGAVAPVTPASPSKIKRRKSRGVMGIRQDDKKPDKWNDGVTDTNIIAHPGGPTAGTRSKSGLEPKRRKT